MSGGGLLGAALGASARTAVSMLALGALAAAVLWGADQAVTRAHLRGGRDVIAMVTIWALVVFAESAAASAIALRHVRKEPASFGGALATAGRRLWPVTGVSVCMAAAFTAGVGALVVPGLAALAALALALPAAVDGRGGPWRALVRSVELTRGHRLPVLGVVLALLASTFVAVVSFVDLVLLLEDAIGGQVVTVAALFGSQSLAAIPAVGVAAVYDVLQRSREAPRAAELERVFE